jgi:hypothetical protein
VTLLQEINLARHAITISPHVNQAQLCVRWLRYLWIIQADWRCDGAAAMLSARNVRSGKEHSLVHMTEATTMAAYMLVHVLPWRVVT